METVIELEDEIRKDDNKNISHEKLVSNQNAKALKEINAKEDRINDGITSRELPLLILKNGNTDTMYKTSI